MGGCERQLKDLAVQSMAPFPRPSFDRVTGPIQISKWPVGAEEVLAILGETGVFAPPPTPPEAEITPVQAARKETGVASP